MRFERQKQRILDAATFSLNQKGVWGMTLQEVAGALDLGTSSVTYYFKRREHLAAAVFEDSLLRLAEIVRRAGEEPTQRKRVARYVELYFDQFARALRGESRPFAILSEIRAMEEATRSTLVAQYQTVFRAVRAFFGPSETPERKRLLTARAHILNEALFWSEIWLRRFAIGDLPNVRERLLAVLDGGLVTSGTPWRAAPIHAGPVPEEDERQAYLRVATRLINDFGYKGTSVERIAGELKRAKTSLYRHIEGKDELVAACSRESFHRLAALRRLAETDRTSAWDRIATILSSVLALQFSGDYPLLRSSALQAMPAPVRHDAVERSERTALGLMGLLVEAMQDGSMRVVDPFIASHFIMSSLDASYDLKGWRTGQPLTVSIDTYMNVLATGIFDPE
ncbi:TetR/AcrR family transcriptional regulator [Niveispirillum sp.]|uniref:TetR/AcrR family transcriptional regulator n=1 Tax=Niveispirillum sp. TaxID=1917217 RepID=UPI001B6A1120|nr:TetR/AcrR family transcriptional regulator [Niveispirillum sp.]MBP7335709.1 TetR/AcrR family transcriptional regulator [Niveispirillum sp.]